MTDTLHLIQDLRAEAHTAPPRVARLMREAAARLERDCLIDAAVLPPPFPPPGDFEAVE